LAALILLAWLGALGWLVRRQTSGPDPKAALANWPVPPGAAYQAVRIAGRHVGLASLTVDTVEDALRVTDLLTVTLPDSEARRGRRSSMLVRASYSRSLRLRTWESDLLTGEGRVAAAGEVIGDTLLRVVVTPLAETPETLQAVLRRPVILSGGIGLLAASQGLPRVGDRFSVQVFDPFDLELRMERVVVAAESVFTVPDSAEFNSALRRWTSVHSDTVRAWRLETQVHGLPEQRWIDASGMTTLLQHPLGGVLERTAFEIANARLRNPIGIWDTSASAPRFLGVGAPELQAPRIAVALSLASGAPIPINTTALEAGNQRRWGDTLIVEARARLGSSLPTLEDSVLLTVPDSAIRELARRLQRASGDSVITAHAMSEWVRRTITLRRGPGLRSAGRVLGTRAGAEADRVTLLLALSRAAGWPARSVWGVARTGKGWELRGWAEVHLNDWVPLDPNRPPPLEADRVRLAIGGQPRMLELALRAGQLRLTPVEDHP
jgi:transglutaminase-like putative cysteine protease